MPEIAQSFVVPFPRDQVWRFFRNPAQVATCMPGASLTEPPDGNRIVGQMRVKLGPIAAAFAGKAELAMDDASWAGTIHGEGLDKKSSSRAKSTVNFAVHEQPGGTRVDIKVDFTLTGILAQFSRGAIVQEVARRLTDDFAGNLAARMAAAGAGEPSPAAASVTPPNASSEEHPAIGLLGVLWSAFMAWLARFSGARRPAGDRKP